MAFRLLDYHEGLVELRNKFFFTNLNDFDFTWRFGKATAKYWHKDA